MASNTQSTFEDFLPIMAHKLGGVALIGELCNGFRLLMDGDKGVITFDSQEKRGRFGVAGIDGRRFEKYVERRRFRRRRGPQSDGVLCAHVQDLNNQQAYKMPTSKEPSMELPGTRR